MQERRTTIRVPHQGRAQYCSSGDLLPKDGSITNLSERGAAVRVREPHTPGERVTVHFPLPGAQEALTTTGIVRWSGAEPERGRGVPVGLEWLPFEETTGHLLHRFLNSSRQTASARASSGRGRVLGRDPSTRRVALRWGILCGLFVAIFCWQLGGAILDGRHAMIQRLEEHGTHLRSALDSAMMNLRATSDEVERLSQQAQALEGRAQALSQEVTQFQQSSAALHQERSALIDRVLELEQARAALIRRSVPVDELQLAIRETIARKQAAQSFFSRVLPGTTERHQWVRAGSRGYRIQDGQRATPSRPFVEVHVHEPELP